jgi:hypothetical protein
MPTNPVKSTIQASRKLLSLRNTAEAVDRSPPQVRRWTKLPDMKFPEAVVLANKLYFFEDEILAWLENHRASKQEPTTFQTKRIEASAGERR